MYELSGNIKELRIDYQTGKAFMILSLNQKQQAINCFDELHLEEKLSFKIDKYREKRSLNANSYCWKLIGEIADKVMSSKEEVYFEMLKRYGQSEMISVVSNIPITEYVKYCEKAGESTLNGKEFTHYKVYKGSSEFDTKEMSILIDGVVSEAKELGIQTETPEQIANLKSLWGE